MTQGRDRAQDAARLFDGERLTLARQLAGLRKNQLAEKIDKTPTSITAYESGRKRPAAATVAQLAMALGIDPDFFLPSSGELQAASAPHFRSLRSTTQIARDSARAYGLMVIEIVSSLERHVEFPTLDLPTRSVDLDSWEVDEPQEAARLVRSAWEMTTGPAGHIVRLLENKGIFLAFTSRQISAIDAYSFSSDSRPIILLNPTKDDYYRQRWDVAHELGHLVMHADAEPGSRDAEEQANRFAAEFLLPESEVRSHLPDRADWRHLQVLKEEWGVSIQALLFRARRLGVMTEQAYKTAMTTVSARGWRRQEPGRSVLIEQPSLLPRAVEVLDQVGITDYSLANECRVPIELFRIATARTPNASFPNEVGHKRVTSRLTVVP
ncbi:XRE family transcriptional regulator [Pseudonocardia nematodicida]|uniref:XRE family transcriptional regulator n=1 Tax=Pseudonocardia nematodicida TaxID=1206997 RepID=A0ABV1KCS4_9PSEU